MGIEAEEPSHDVDGCRESDDNSLGNRRPPLAVRDVTLSARRSPVGHNAIKTVWSMPNG
jgi:hypothetical protein